jgi:O-antigen ligase
VSVLLSAVAQDRQLGAADRIRGAGTVPGDRLTCCLWALVLFGLTNPFTFILTGENPALGSSSDLLTHRRPDFSQLNLYLLRFAMVAAALALGVGRMTSPGIAARRLLPLAPFLAWAALTVFWTDAPASTRNALVALGALILAAFVAAARLSLEQLARAFIASIALSALLSLATVVLAPQLGIHQPTDAAQAIHAGAWRGIHMHKNALGPLSAVFLSALLFAGRPLIGPLAKWSLVALLALLVVMSRSALAIAIIPAAAATGWIAVRTSAAARLLAAVFLTLLAVLSLLGLDLLLAGLGRDTTLTGRTGIWSVAFAFIEQSPLTGFGFRSLSYGGFAYRAAVATGLADPHNGFLDLALGTGLIGVLLLLGAIVFAFHAAGGAARAGHRAQGAAQLFAAALAGWLLTNLSETNMQALRAEGAFGFMLLIALLVARPAAHEV